jgi:hypothetical protein
VSGRGGGGASICCSRCPVLPGVPSFTVCAPVWWLAAQEMNRAVGCVAERLLRAPSLKPSEGLRRQLRASGVPYYFKCELVQVRSTGDPPARSRFACFGGGEGARHDCAASVRWHLGQA